MKVSTPLGLVAAHGPLTLALAVSPRTPKCADLKLPPQLDSSFEVLSVNSVEVYNYSQPYVLGSLGYPVSGLNVCNITVAITHTNDDDYNILRVWLPLDKWNGRFQVTGGGGLSTGYLDVGNAPAASQGYATANSEGGLTLNQTIDSQSGSWFLRSNGSVNNGLVENYSFRATHDAAVVGKALTEQFYGACPEFSYYTGCSQGGKQGFWAAAHNPDDFDGILAASPALVDGSAIPMLVWPTVVMEETAVPAQCVFNQYLAAIIEACDVLDGARDGLISDPENCHFDTTSLVGSVFNCSGEDVTITSAHAEVVSKILQSPKLPSGEQVWWMISPGTEFWGLANTTLQDGKFVPVPFTPGIAFLRYLIYHDPTYDVLNMTYADFDEAVALAGNYNETFLPYPFDYSAFRDRGGKLLSWHGLADQFIPHQGTLHFYDVIESNTRSANGSIDDFLRLFLAPGAGHCYLGGYGPAPVDPLSALVDWVEAGVAPDTLLAALTKLDSTTITRDLCPWPMMPIYHGQGDVSAESSFSCK
ncbi:hypothetical protein LTR84_004396 [Exophiala bonariae]|uniref:Carboxylic ester hydrolase n=1 Tax=Exophiala bonariae TaxID=1690606 RepID=A0AAV9N812_9EURO|nr:hypothetical protein LTR84_004396 [Exophiala bonariae]